MIYLLILTVCFISPAHGILERIVGGRPAKWGEVPSIASIRLRSKDAKRFGTGHRCGACLIDQYTVLSAAHCFIDSDTGKLKLPLNRYQIVGGHLNRFDMNATSYLGVFEKLYIPKEYISAVDGYRKSDIALLKLFEPVPENDTVFRPIAMLDENTTMVENTTCIIAGWGSTKAAEGLNPPQRTPILKIAKVKLFNNWRCFRRYKRRENILCAGLYRGGTDSCKGDSGGPLICNDVLAGIVSFGRACALPGFPTVYTHIGRLREWIRLRSEGIEDEDEDEEEDNHPDWSDAVKVHSGIFIIGICLGIVRVHLYEL